MLLFDCMDDEVRNASSSATVIQEVRQFQIADLGRIDLVAMLVELLPHHQADCLHLGWVIHHSGGDLEAIPKNGENCPVFNELRRVHMTFIKQTN